MSHTHRLTHLLILGSCYVVWSRSIALLLKLGGGSQTTFSFYDLFNCWRHFSHTDGDRIEEKCMASSSPTFSFLYLSPFETDSFHDCLNICQHKIILLLSICYTNDSSKYRLCTGNSAKCNHSFLLHTKLALHFLHACCWC